VPWQAGLEHVTDPSVGVAQRPAIGVMHDKYIVDFEEAVEGQDVVDRVCYAPAYVAEDDHSVFSPIVSFGFQGYLEICWRKWEVGKGIVPVRLRFKKCSGMQRGSAHVTRSEIV
jgi:hypothetical protein